MRVHLEVDFFHQVKLQSLMHIPVSYKETLVDTLLTTVVFRKASEFSCPGLPPFFTSGQTSQFSFIPFLFCLDP